MIINSEIKTDAVALTVHLIMRNGYPGNDFLNHAADELHDKFGIKHTTIQLEIGN